MRKHEVVKIDAREFTVKELTVRQIWNLFQGDDTESSPLSRMETLMSLACPELTKAVAMDMAPSELVGVLDAFKKVNSDFLAVARMVGMDAILDQVRAAIQQSVSSTRLFAP